MGSETNPKSADEPAPLNRLCIYPFDLTTRNLYEIDEPKKEANYSQFYLRLMKSHDFTGFLKTKVLKSKPVLNQLICYNH